MPDVDAVAAEEIPVSRRRGGRRGAGLGRGGAVVSTGPVRPGGLGGQASKRDTVLPDEWLPNR